MADPFVSILIPCYNAAPFLGDTIRSALAQTWARKEVIIVDDGSTDGSLEIAGRFESHGVKVVSQTNAGQSAAFNRGLREAQGDYCEFLDSDDLLHPEKIRRQVEALAPLEPGWIASGAWARFQVTPGEASFQEELVWRDLDPVAWLASSWSGGGMMHGAAWLIPRVIVDRAGPWAEDLTLVNDFDFFSRAVLQSAGIKFCRDALSYYRSGVAGSVSSLNSYGAWVSAYESFTRGTNLLLSRENSPRTRTAVARTFQSFAYSAYPTAPDLVAKAEARVRDLGGSDYKLKSGPLFNTISAFAGWKFARKAQAMYAGMRKRSAP